jgi:hypothetical protein
MAQFKKPEIVLISQSSTCVETLEDAWFHTFLFSRFILACLMQAGAASCLAMLCTVFTPVIRIHNFLHAMASQPHAHTWHVLAHQLGIPGTWWLFFETWTVQHHCFEDGFEHGPHTYPHHLLRVVQGEPKQQSSIFGNALRMGCCSDHAD